ncbi:hypothetical protein ADZ36_20320 [Streptomyces fradiae]|uniref:TnpV protein n=2 Tax=Streptomyces TaxID=1883 RepID=A0A3R7EJL4_9ACTN|nr:hypothetical protein ADZ36_20320 [Streptomyces fradiae]OFA50987.1 hypothetical protein BEN35_15000 [Streptomyces fradiae]PQM19514.1 hypothetical protein Sfr7A_31885 [Streptomyces xinghaiensis]RKM90996.1 hypothetical protein SFRA_030675 [Streptomyces xinghaiensis]RNC68997.1 hypothetical protein DC095_030920 [Streptomyces xinghaiensis]
MDVNQYGRRAQQHWQEFRPGSVAELDDPEAFFGRLGDDVQNEIRLRWTAERLAVPTVAGEPYLERVGRLQQLRHEAEAEVLRELVLLPAENDADQVDDPHLTDEELAEEQWREHHFHELLEGRSRPEDFTGAERERLRDEAPRRLLELTGLSDEALRRRGLL